MSDAHHHGAPDHAGPDPTQDPAAFWEERYGDDRVWSGRPNHALVTVLADLADELRTAHNDSRPSALDLGCGEGGDVIWLAQSGWHATGVDISPTAIARGREAAATLGVTDHTEWLASDLSAWRPDRTFHLVSACFFQSPVALDRQQILRTAMTAVAEGGHFLCVAHATPPPGSPHRPDEMPTVASELEDLGVTESGGRWQVRVAEVRHREGIDRDGNPAGFDDTVVLLQRLPDDA